MNSPTCLLCEAPGATTRPGRLGRYAQTCDDCEARRGSHLTTRERRELVTGPLRALQWSARPR